jgi:hypothetical protein
MIAYLPERRDGIVCVKTTYGMERFGVRIPAEARDCLFSKTFRPSLRPIELPVQKGRAVLSPG